MVFVALYVPWNNKSDVGQSTTLDRCFFRLIETAKLASNERGTCTVCASGLACKVEPYRAWLSSERAYGLGPVTATGKGTCQTSGGAA